jgi:alkylation response protein AidB-like acyl-CoA dehydrogenase
MSIAITEDHKALADVVADFCSKHDLRGQARVLLDADPEELPTTWPAMADLGWLGLHVAEEHGGSGFGLPELVVVVEQLGREIAPGPFVPTVIASAAIAAAATADQAARLLPRLVDGSTTAGVGLTSVLEVSGGTATATGDAGVVLGAALADLLVVPAGDDLLVIDRRAAGVAVEVPANVDRSRRSGRVTLSNTPVEVVVGGRRALVDLGRLLLAAEATGIARACTDQAAEYAKVREQFGRVIATFQAVKHHCANMLVAAELATGAVWDAARSAGVGGDQFTYACAVAATLAVPAAYDDAQLDIQVHGGIGFTWEHDAHMYLRRAVAIGAIVDVDSAASEVTDQLRKGTRLVRAVELPPEAEAIRDDVKAIVAELKDLDDDERTRRLVTSGYAVPHWPEPYGLAAGAIEQLVIEEEFKAAGIRKPAYSITGWVILTLIQHGTDDQVARWVQPALDQKVIWCQLFSEPDAGSDAAGVKTKATRVDGGWLLNGQKVWTSGAHEAGFGLATVRTDPDVAKHAGITTMVIDMHGPGVEVRPLKMPTGGSEFNEVFLTDVFVPDDDVVGAVDQGWTVARATLGNESVSLGGSDGYSLGGGMLLGGFAAHPDRLSGGAARIGAYQAKVAAVETLGVRSAQRAVAGGGPGPEGAVTKLVQSENMQEMAVMQLELAGPDAAFLDGPGSIASNLALVNRALSIAGGTSEIKRNQIGERLLGLPRDPLLN